MSVAINGKKNELECPCCFTTVSSFTKEHLYKDYDIYKCELCGGRFARYHKNGKIVVINK